MPLISQNQNGNVQIAASDSAASISLLPQNMGSEDMYMTGNGYATYRFIIPFTAGYEKTRAIGDTDSASSA